METNEQAIVGTLCCCLSVIMFITPMCDRSTKEMPFPFPYQVLATLISCAVWVLFGLITPNGYRVAIINTVGLLIHLVYLAILLRHSKDVLGFNLWLGFFGGAFWMGVSALMVFAIISSEITRTRFMGIQCLIFCSGMYFCPFLAMREVRRKKDHRLIPMWVCVPASLNGCGWSIYAYMLSNYYSMVTNGIGCTLGLLQIATHIIYRYFETQNQQNGIVAERALPQQ